MLASGRFAVMLVMALGLSAALVAPARAAPSDADTLIRTGDPERYQVSVSATKLPRRTEDVANALTIVSGDELRRRGTRTLASYTELDAAASYAYDRYRLSVTGRNLGDDRHIIAESELGDSQFYVAPTRRVSAEVGVSY